jgi:hypothetical protein
LIAAHSAILITFENGMVANSICVRGKIRSSTSGVRVRGHVVDENGRPADDHIVRVEVADAEVEHDL